MANKQTPSPTIESVSDTLSGRGLRLAFAGLLMASSVAVGCGGSQERPSDADRRAAAERAFAEEDSRASQPAEAEEEEPEEVELSAEEQAARAEAERQASARAEAEEEARQQSRARALEDAVERARNGDYVSARRDLEQFTDDPELGAHAEFDLGVIAYYQGEEGRARRHFEAALEKDPAFGPAASAIVREYLRSGEEARARQFLREQTVKSDEDPAIASIELMIPLREGRYEEVIEEARQIFMEDPSNLDAHYALALANMELGRMELARYILQQGLTRDPNRVELKFALARLAVLQGNNVRARNLLVEVLDKAPFHPEANNNLGVLNLQTSNYEDAVRNFQRATASAPWFAQAWMNLGNAYKQLRRYEDARDAFQRASRLDPNFADPYFNLAILYMDAVDFERLDRVGRMETALDFFAQYRDLAGQLPPDHRVFEYQAEAEQIIETQRELERQTREAEEAAAAEEEDDFGDFFDEGDGSGEDGAEDGATEEGGGDDDFGDFEW